VPYISAEFTIPTTASGARGITRGFDGFMYFAEDVGNKIGKMTTGGAFTEFAIPTAGAKPFGVLGTSDGNIWFTERGASKIGVFATSTQTFTEYPLPTANAGPTYIALGPDGALWFSETAANKLGRIDRNGNISEYPVPTVVAFGFARSAGLAGLVGYSDGGVWVAENNASSIVRFDVTARTFGAPHWVSGVPYVDSAGPTEIVVCPDGQTLCFSEANVGILGQINPTTGVVTLYNIYPPQQYCPGPGIGCDMPYALVRGADSNLYFTDAGLGRVGQISGVSFEARVFAIPSGLGSTPDSMSLGPDAQIYFTEYAANKVGRLTYF
jgi:virginiamycin B lyase